MRSYERWNFSFDVDLLLDFDVGSELDFEVDFVVGLVTKREVFVDVFVFTDVLLGVG